MQCRRLLAGETVTWRGDRFSLDQAKLRYYTERRPIPIYVAATGPKMLELGGEVGDGVFVHVGANPKTVAFAMERVRAGARIAGRDPGAVDISLFLFCSISPDRRECLDDCRMASALIVSRVPDYARIMGYDPKLVAEIRETWKRTASAATAGRLVPDEWVEDLNLVGMPAEVAKRIESLAALGIRHITLLPRGHSRRPIEDRDREIVRRARHAEVSVSRRDDRRGSSVPQRRKSHAPYAQFPAGPKKSLASEHAAAKRREDEQTGADPPHWRISSARASNAGGIVRPRAFAVLRLITSSNLCGLLDGEIGGLRSFRTLST